MPITELIGNGLNLPERCQCCTLLLHLIDDTREFCVDVDHTFIRAIEKRVAQLCLVILGIAGCGVFCNIVERAERW